MGLFKRKPGGTPLGNTFRAITHKISGGILGNGLLMKKPAVVGGVAVQPITPAPQTGIVQTAITSGLDTSIEVLNSSQSTNQNSNNQKTEKVDIKTKLFAWVQNNKVVAIVAGVVVVVAGFLYFKGRKTKRK
jgi:hypothetical protein